MRRSLACLEALSVLPIGFLSVLCKVAFVSRPNACIVPIAVISLMMGVKQLGDQLQETFLLQLLAKVTPHAAIKNTGSCCIGSSPVCLNFAQFAH